MTLRTGAHVFCPQPCDEYEMQSAQGLPICRPPTRESGTPRSPSAAPSAHCTLRFQLRENLTFALASRRVHTFTDTTARSWVSDRERYIDPRQARPGIIVIAHQMRTIVHRHQKKVTENEHICKHPPACSVFLLSSYRGIFLRPSMHLPTFFLRHL